MGQGAPCLPGRGVHLPTATTGGRVAQPAPRAPWGTSCVTAVCVFVAGPGPLIGGSRAEEARHPVPLAPGALIWPRAQSLGHPSHQCVRELQAPPLPTGAGEGRSESGQSRGGCPQWVPEAVCFRLGMPSGPQAELPTPGGGALAGSRGRGCGVGENPTLGYLPQPMSCPGRSSLTSSSWAASSTASRAPAWTRSPGACSPLTSSQGRCS